MLTKRKKIIILSSMLGLLVITAVLNILLSNPEEPNVPGGAQGGNYFSQVRSQRFTERSQAILFYTSILADDNASPELKADAERNKLLLIEAGEQELIVEALIKARGFEDVIVTHTTGKINVIVKESSLTKDRMQIIFNIIMDNFPKATEDMLVIVPVV